MTGFRSHPSASGGSALARRTATLAPDLGSAKAARTLLAATLDATGCQQWADSAALALSEVVTNAVLHAHTTIEVVIEVFPSRLHVEVRDANPFLPQQCDYDAKATTGRGISLVAAVTSRWGVHSLGARGKVVWFTLTDAPVATGGGSNAELDIEDLLDAWDDDDGWDTPGLPPATVSVVLAQMPLLLWLAAQQHHDAILRELVLSVAAHDVGAVDHGLADTARGLVNAAVQDAVAGTEHPVVAATVPIAVPRDAAAAFVGLQHALDTAEKLASSGQMLILPGLPEIVAVRNWVCDQVLAQLAGGVPTPWPGTAQRRFETLAALAPDAPWNDEDVQSADGYAVAADDTNRIVAVSRPLAALLGWTVEELVGRRVVTLIPQRLREAHIAGFTRHLLTGETHVLGTPVILPVLCANGSELPCQVLIEHAPVGTGRSVFLAWIEPAPQP